MKIEEVDKYIKDNTEDVLDRCAKILNRPEVSLQSFNGIFGGKNGLYGIQISDYSSPEEYVKAWMDAEKREYNNDHAVYNNSIKRIEELLKDDKIKKYVEIYLARTYLRKM